MSASILDVPAKWEITIKNAELATKTPMKSTTAWQLLHLRSKNTMLCLVRICFNSISVWDLNSRSLKYNSTFYNIALLSTYTPRSKPCNLVEWWLSPTWCPPKCHNQAILFKDYCLFLQIHGSLTQWLQPLHSRIRSTPPKLFIVSNLEMGMAKISLLVSLL